MILGTQLGTQLGLGGSVRDTVRFSGFSGTVTESGGVAAGWTYTNSAGAAATTVPDKTLAVSADGSFGFTALGYVPANTNTAMLGMTVNGGRAGFATFDWVMYGETQTASGFYKMLASGVPVVLNGNASLPHALGDMLRARRAGGSLVFEVSKDGGGSYAPVHSFAGSTVKLYPQIAYTGLAQAASISATGLT